MAAQRLQVPHTWPACTPTKMQADPIASAPLLRETLKQRLPFVRPLRGHRHLRSDRDEGHSAQTLKIRAGTGSEHCDTELDGTRSGRQHFEQRLRPRRANYAVLPRL